MEDVESSASEVSDNDTDDDNEPMSTNMCADCHTTSELCLHDVVGLSLCLEYSHHRTSIKGL